MESRSFNSENSGSNYPTVVASSEIGDGFDRNRKRYPSEGMQFVRPIPFSPRARKSSLRVRFLALLRLCLQGIVIRDCPPRKGTAAGSSRSCPRPYLRASIQFSLPKLVEVARYFCTREDQAGIKRK